MHIKHKAGQNYHRPDNQLPAGPVSQRTARRWSKRSFSWGTLYSETGILTAWRPDIL